MQTFVPPRLALFGLLFVLLSDRGLTPVSAQEEGLSLPPPATRNVDFERDIRPILVSNCFACHGPEKQRSEFRLDDRTAAFHGGLGGPAIVRGRAPRAN
jgi:hypothetical protein